MDDYKRLMNAIYKKGGGYKTMEIVVSEIESLFSELFHVNKELYDKYIEKFEFMAYQITESEAVEYVSKLTNKNKSLGGHWNIYETDEVAIKFDVPKKVCDFGDEYYREHWYIALNMAYAHYYKEERQVQDYVELALDFLLDSNADSYKVAKYMMYIR